MKKTNLLTSFGVLATLSLLGSGCGGGEKWFVPTKVITGPPSSGLSWSSDGSGCLISSTGVEDCSPFSSGASSGSSAGSSSGVSSSGGQSSTGSTSSSSSGSGSSSSSTGTGTSSGYSEFEGTKDTYAMKANLESANFDENANQLATTYSLNIDAARQLVQLSDKMSQLQNKQGGLTAEDQAAITGAALGVAGIRTDEVNAATAQAIQNKDMTAVNALLAKGAANTGTTVTILRDQILPSLGLNLGTLGQ